MMYNATFQSANSTTNSGTKGGSAMSTASIIAETRPFAFFVAFVRLLVSTACSRAAAVPASALTAPAAAAAVKKAAAVSRTLTNVPSVFTLSSASPSANTSLTYSSRDVSFALATLDSNVAQDSNQRFAQCAFLKDSVRASKYSIEGLLAGPVISSK